MEIADVATPSSPLILIVEDDQRLMMVLGMLLEFEQFRFAEATDGQAALDWLASNRPALVILDWLLPKLGGAQVLAAVRDSYGTKVPVLVLSAVAEEVRGTGADAYMRKPYIIEELVGVIRQLLAA
ncbi:MAG TPA: response regulator [Chloroflexota bacterium]|nr:response regulator [Chloroflexota bacterium]